RTILGERTVAKHAREDGDVSGDERVVVHRHGAGTVVEIDVVREVDYARRGAGAENQRRSVGHKEWRTTPHQRIGSASQRDRIGPFGSGKTTTAGAYPLDLIVAIAE